MKTIGGFPVKKNSLLASTERPEGAPSKTEHILTGPPVESETSKISKHGLFPVTTKNELSVVEAKTQSTPIEVEIPNVSENEPENEQFQAVQNDCNEPLELGSVQKPFSSPKPSVAEPGPIMKPNHNEILKGMVIVISGIENPERAVLRQRALNMGAQYRPYWCLEATHLLCAFHSTPKFFEVINSGHGIIVRPDYIQACEAQGSRLDEHDFLLDKPQPVSYQSGSIVSNDRSDSEGEEIEAEFTSSTDTASEAQFDTEEMSSTTSPEPLEEIEEKPDSERPEKRLKGEVEPLKELTEQTGILPENHHSVTVEGEKND